MRERKFSAALILVLTLASAAVAQPQMWSVNNGRGNVPLYAPADYDGSTPLPLIVGLHGYGSNPGYLEPYFDLLTQIETKQFLYMIPTGTTDFAGSSFWAATNACCQFGFSNVDDSSYLRGLVDMVRNQYSVDDLSIHFTGHSNGGFMSHRMAIDHADLVASIASVAGANFSNAGAFNPSEPVHVLQIHGTADPVILYGGGSLAGSSYPGAVQTTVNWANYNGIDIDSTSTESFNLDWNVAGDETTSFVYDPDNVEGVAVELWSMNGSGHSPSFGDGASQLFAPRVVDWLLTHRKSIPSGGPGDFDDDSDVDGIDFLTWQGTDGTSTGLTDWQINYGTLPSGIAVATSVPEPQSAALLAVAILISRRRMLIPAGSANAGTVAGRIVRA